ncbi:hypothetical protein HRbin36_01597 [bacterium HR36]|nr:hypothetical protein HRbin36_01597 [bacterium HR36]
MRAFGFTINLAMSNTLRTVLVLLRLAIGWHLLVEGYVKLHSLSTGPTDSSQPFTSLYYLQQSVGPMSGFFRWMAGGDPDEVLLHRLTVRGEDGHPQLSDAMRQYWEQYLENFVRTFDVDGHTSLEMRKKLEEHGRLLAHHLVAGQVEWQKPSDWGPIKKKQTLPQWLNEYRQRLAELRDLETRERPYFERAVGRERVTRLRSELAWYRSQFTAELRNRTDGLLRAWRELLPAEKKGADLTLVPEPVSGPTWLGYPLVWWADRTTAWGLTIAGGCLLFGFLSRMAAWLGFILVLLFYLCQPPLPWTPLPERAEGYYLYVNKNLIEALALAVLGLLPTGRWFGLDGLVHAVFARPSSTAAPSPQPPASSGPSR